LYNDGTEYEVFGPASLQETIQQDCEEEFLLPDEADNLPANWDKLQWYLAEVADVWICNLHFAYDVRLKVAYTVYEWNCTHWHDVTNFEQFMEMMCTNPPEGC